MKTKFHIPSDSAKTSLISFPCFVLATLFFATSCTQRTITTKSRSYSIVGSGGEADDSDKLKQRYTAGFEIGEDGTMQTNKKDLYSEKSFRKGKNKDAELKSFRLGKKEMAMKEYRTPEYLNRQKDFRTKKSNLHKYARESDVDRFTTADSFSEARIKDRPGLFDWLNPFSKKNDYQGAEKTYRTSINRRGSRAVDSAPSPEPMSQLGASPQDQRNDALSMDDVKKMLNPAAYRSP